jgi:hypothetical protein
MVVPPDELPPPYGFALSVYETCVLIHSSGNLFLAIYVDDISIFGPSDDDITENPITALKTEFEDKDLGEIHWLLGINIDLTEDDLACRTVTPYLLLSIQTTNFAQEPQKR